ncbi:MAG: hypothetical protein KGS72_19805 [Cyanobacteria bacterium REEB67]|nr:hypothetical protein [Cyanobacteria bacterium REEB67]
MKSKRLSVEIGITARDPMREQPWEPVPASKRNTADMLKEYSAGVLIKGYRAYLRGDYVDSRRFAQFMERTKEKRGQSLEGEFAQYKNGHGVTRLRRLEGRFNWALSLRENISAFVLHLFGLKGNCRLRKVDNRVQQGSGQTREVQRV